MNSETKFARLTEDVMSMFWFVYPHTKGKRIEKNGCGCSAQLTKIHKNSIV